MKINKKYDVIIIGGGTSGVSCAWNCGKLGLKTLIIEQNSFLGGSITASLVIPAMKTSDNEINTNFFNALFNKLKLLNGSIIYSDGNKGWFNPELTKIALDILMKEAGVDILFESHVKEVNKKNNKILSISIESIYFVDSTGDANFCQKINADFLNKNEKINTQPTSLRFIMSGVNVEKFENWIMQLDSNRDITSSCRIDGYTYLSTAYTWDNNIKWALKPIFEQAIANGVVTEEDTNYFQVFSVAGTTDSIAFNAPRILNNKLSRTESYIQGRASILRISQFCKKYLSGFENAYISSIANSLGVRVSSRVKGKYTYTYEDLITGKTFSNPVVISNYPVDIHSNKKDASTLEKSLKEYQLPVESLIVDKFDNVFVSGRCLSADFKAQAALRIIPSCFSMGEGLAKYLYMSLRKN